jgi:hypothetical protein
MPNVTSPVQNIHRYSIERITKGVEDSNYMGRKLEEDYEKWGIKLWKKAIFRYGSFRGIANQWK